jgi:hypothetical protein
MQPDILQALRTFADKVKAKVSANAPGEPEAQLSAPVATLIEDFGKIIHRNLVAKAESALGDLFGNPLSYARNPFHVWLPGQLRVAVRWMPPS